MQPLTRSGSSLATFLRVAVVLAIACSACGRTTPRTSAVVPGGNPEHGRTVIRQYGCGTCHTIPGVRSAVGRVAPPLTAWPARRFIAGALVNDPANLVRWIMSPQSIEPGTAMPDVGLSVTDATDVAAYLYSLGLR